MNSQQTIKNFLLNFRESDIKNVITDWRLHAEGYEMRYSIDTSDIVSYFLPYRQDQLITTENVYWLQRMIAYEFFFNSMEKEDKIIIMDEYKGELLSIKNDISRSHNNFYKIKEKIESFFRNNYEGSKKISLLEDDFDLLVSFLVLLEKNEVSGGIHSEFLSFIKNKLSIFQSDDSNQQLIELFEATQKSELSVRIYREFVENNKLYLLGLRSDFERYIYLENTYRDIVVVERLMNVNKKIFEGFNGLSKTVIYYLSSAVFKSRKIMECQSTMTNLPQRIGVAEENIIFNFNRNILQVFLLNILKEEYKENKLSHEPISILEALRLLVKEFHAQNETIKSIANNNDFDTNNTEPILSKSSFEKIISLLDKHLLSHIQNQFYLRVYEQKREALRDVMESKNYSVIQDILSRIDKAVIAEKHLLGSIEIQSHTYTNARAVTESLKTYPIYNPLGKDEIRNPFCHLPLLLFVSSTYSNIVAREFYDLQNIISESPLGLDLEINKYNKLLNPIIRKISANKNSLILLNFDLIATNYLLLITKPTLIYFQKSRENIIQNLKTHRERLLNSRSKVFLGVEKEFLHVSFNDVENLTQEIDYFLIWLLRREGLYDEGIELAQKNIKDGDNIGIFHQGMALCLISKYYSEENKNIEYLDFFNEVQYHLDKALRCQVTLLKEKESHSEFNKLIQKTILSILDNIVLIILGKLELLVDGFCDLDNELKEVRYKIKQEIEPLLRELNVDLTTLCYFNLSEAYLEYLEALFIFKTENKGNALIALTKIMHSSTRIITFQHKRDYIPNYHFKLVTKVNKLRYRLLRYLNYI